VVFLVRLAFFAPILFRQGGLLLCVFGRPLGLPRPSELRLVGRIFRQAFLDCCLGFIQLLCRLFDALRLRRLS
jgi:hypothetical protein